MELVKVFVRNFESLLSAHGEKSASAFWNKINEKAGKPVLVPSYWSKIKNSVDTEKPHNVSLGIIEQTAKALEIEGWQLINPMGFDSHGQSRASTGSPDLKIMEDSVRFAIRAAESEGREEDITFISKVAVASYEAHVSDQKDDLTFRVLKIAREVAPSI